MTLLLLACTFVFEKTDLRLETNKPEKLSGLKSRLLTVMADCDILYSFIVSHRWQHSHSYSDQVRLHTATLRGASQLEEKEITQP